MAGNFSVFLFIILCAYEDICTFVLAEGSFKLASVEENAVFVKHCNTTKALSITYGDSFENCFSDCQHSLTCTVFMFHHRMKQCALHDSLFSRKTLRENQPVCLYVKLNKTAVSTLSDRKMCDSTEKYDNLKGKCYLSNCPKPGNIENAYLLATTTRKGYENRYKCKPGYFGTGNSKIVCQSNASWSATNFRCMNAYCPVPTTIDHAISHLPTKTKIGSTTRYSCLSGLFPLGSPDIYCQLNATWTTVNFTCSPANCPPAKYISNAYLETSDTLIGTITKYKCNTGYLGTGYPEIRCHMNATWSSVQFHCEKLCSIPKNVSTAQLVSVVQADNETEYRSGTKVSYACNFGYQGEGKNTTNICDTNGYWRSQRVMCCRNETVSYSYWCYKAFTMGSIYNISGVTTMCQSLDMKWVSTPMGLYNSLLARDQHVMPLMLSTERKSVLQEHLYRHCLSKHMNATELKNYKGASYDETRLIILENKWNKIGSYWTVRNCRGSLVNNWHPGQPNGHDIEDCTAYGPLTEFKYIDINCEFSDTDTKLDVLYPKEQFGFSCRYSPPSV